MELNAYLPQIFSAARFPMSRVQAMLVLVLAVLPLANGAGPVNVLHVVVDDLRVELPFYAPGHRIVTPSLDKLATEAVIFDRAFAQQAVCNPSRASFLTGRRPDRTRVWNIEDNFRSTLPQHEWWTTLPGLFKKAGWLTLGVGKVFHGTNWQNGQGRNDPWGMADGLASWSPEALPFRMSPGTPCPQNNGSVYEDWCIVPPVADIETVDLAVDLLDDAVGDERPFYLAVGLHKPHLPFQAKQEHFDLYPTDSIPLPTAEARLAPRGMPAVAYHDSRKDGAASPWSPTADEQTRLARRAYWASITGMDENLGTLLTALDQRGLANSTVVMLHSDHAFHLGEHGGWRKFTNFDVALRVPLLLKVPWLPSRPRCDAVVELVDLMPTLAELAAIDTAQYMSRLEPPLEGTSLVPLLTDARNTIVKPAFSQHPRRPKQPGVKWRANSIDHVAPSNFSHMGLSMRTADWRYTEWYVWDGDALRVDWNQVEAVELYDHRGEDPAKANLDTSECANLAGEDAFKDYQDELSFLLRRHFRRETGPVMTITGRLRGAQ